MEPEGMPREAAGEEGSLPCLGGAPALWERSLNSYCGLFLGSEGLCGLRGRDDIVF